MNELRIWICGSSGKIGKHLTNYFEAEGYTVLGSDMEVNITKVEEVMHFAQSHQPDVIINAAAYTGFENCEQNSLQAYKVNALGARNVAAAANRIHAKLIHISSDDVFTGTDHAMLNEFDQPKPTTTYGKSKLAGEQMIRELHPRHVIIRSSWIYDFSQGGFLRTIFDKVANNEVVEVSDTQFSSPTSIDAFTKLLHKLVNANEYGIFHASCEGECSRYEFVVQALILANMDATLIKKATTIKDGQSGHIRLDNLMLKMTEIDYMPSWKKELECFIKIQGGVLND